jgi:hypothetical protein
MTTSGVSQITYDVATLMEEAYERVGRELRSGYDAITARRSLNIIIEELANKGLHLWAEDQQTLTLTPGVGQYALDPTTLDVIYDAVLRVNPAAATTYDIPCVRITKDAYLIIPNKTTKGRPFQFILERLRDYPQLTFWPYPDQAYQFIYWRSRYLEDIENSTQTVDVPRRFLPVIVAGLAFHLANKAPEVCDINRRNELMAQYNASIEDAMDEDRDRASFFVLPDFRRYR